jgi:hypothetical protein
MRQRGTQFWARRPLASTNLIRSSNRWLRPCSFQTEQPRSPPGQCGEGTFGTGTVRAAFSLPVQFPARRHSGNQRLLVAAGEQEDFRTLRRPGHATSWSSRRPGGRFANRRVGVTFRCAFRPIQFSGCSIFTCGNRNKKVSSNSVRVNSFETLFLQEDPLTHRAFVRPRG